ncbi:rhodanese-like domain-containing protein [Oxalobacter sp. OttesenSCG-928-P03]|nr:rhodanese-like domain-containing protein [Oxalobacter sp. OttesenSCG-928-P03]
MNFIWDNIFLIGVVLYCIGALLWPRIRRGSRITHTVATQMINKGKAAIIDIRDQKAYRAGHLLNAIHVPYDSLEERLPRIEKLKSQPVIVVCDDGKQSRSAAEVLRKSGFSQVFSLDGGMAGWKTNGLPVTL